MSQNIHINKEKNVKNNIKKKKVGKMKYEDVQPSDYCITNT